MDELDALRQDAADALGEVFALAFGGGTASQMEIAAKFYVVAQTRYTLACAKATAPR